MRPCLGPSLLRRRPRPRVSVVLGPSEVPSLASLLRPKVRDCPGGSFLGQSQTGSPPVPPSLLPGHVHPRPRRRRTCGTHCPSSGERRHRQRSKALEGMSSSGPPTGGPRCLDSRVDRGGPIGRARTVDVGPVGWSLDSHTPDEAPTCGPTRGARGTLSREVSPGKDSCDVVVEKRQTGFQRPVGP